MNHDVHAAREKLLSETAKISRDLEQVYAASQSLTRANAELAANLASQGHSLDSPDAQAVLGTAADELVEKHHEIAELTAKRDALYREMGRLGPGIPGPAALDYDYHEDGAARPGLALNFGRDQLRDARDAVLARKPVAFGGGIYAATDSSAVPQAAVPQFLLREVFPYLRERPFLYEAFPAEAANATTVTVYRGSGAASAAAFVSPGQTKPTSSPAWQAVEVVCEVVAHLATVDAAVVQDFATWEELIGSEMMAGLFGAIDAGILSGNGVTPNLQGILGAGVGSVVRDTTNESRVDALHRGLTTVRNAFYADPSVLVIHPSDLLAVQTEKAQNSGVYLAGYPNEAEIRSLWGLDIIPTTAITQGTALIFNPNGARLWRLLPGIEINPWESDAWSRNQLSLRCEAKVGFSVVRPQAFCAVLDI